MEKYKDITFKKEADIIRENLECVVEIKQEVEDPLIVHEENGLSMESDEACEPSMTMKAESSEDSKAVAISQSKFRKTPSEQVIKLKRTRRARRKPVVQSVPVKPSKKGFEPTRSSKRPTMKKTVKKFICNRCTYKASTQICLRRHVKSVHSKDFKILCTACGKRFADQDDLSGHVEKNNITTSDGVWQAGIQ